MANGKSKTAKAAMIRDVANKIAADVLLNRANGTTKRFPNPDEWQGDLLDLPTPLGKRLGDCTGSEGRLLAEAYREAAATLCELAAKTAVEAEGKAVALARKNSALRLARKAGGPRQPSRCEAQEGNCQ